MHGGGRFSLLGDAPGPGWTGPMPRARAGPRARPWLGVRRAMCTSMAGELMVHFGQGLRVNRLEFLVENWFFRTATKFCTSMACLLRSHFGGDPLLFWYVVLPQRESSGFFFFQAAIGCSLSTKWLAILVVLL